MRLEIIASNKFRKDLKLARKRGLKLEKLDAVVETLANQLPLDTRYRDYALTGNYGDFRECHIEPDWLLIYRQDEECTGIISFSYWLPF